MFETLVKDDLWINLKKCELLKKELVYLGFIVYQEGLCMA